MSKVLHIALNTFRESSRDRVLYVIAFFGVALMAASQGLGWVSVGEETQIVQDFSLAAISFFGALIAVFVGTGLVYKEIEKRTIYTILSKPVSRWQFLLGKFCGLMAVLLAAVAGMGAIALAIIYYSGCTTPTGDGGFWLDRIDWTLLLQALTLLYFEMMVVVALAIFFSTVSSPGLAAVFTFCAYLVGQITPSLMDLANLDAGGIDYHLRSRDVTDWRAFGAAAGSAQAGGTERLRELLGEKAKEALARAASGGELKAEEKESLVTALNTILDRADFYRPGDFPGAALPEKARELAARRESLDAGGLTRLNRFALEAALPGVIAEGAKLELGDITKESLSPLVNRFQWVLKPFGRVMYYALPDLTHFQLRNRVVYGPPLRQGKLRVAGCSLDGEFGAAVAYAVCYSGMALCLAAMAFDRKRF